MARILDTRFPFPVAEAASAAGGLLRRLGRMLLRALADYRGRRALLALSDAQLKDIGLTRANLGPAGRGRPGAVDWVDLQRRRDGRSF